jgi:hypothetical protein
MTTLCRHCILCPPVYSKKQDSSESTATLQPLSLSRRVIFYFRKIKVTLKECQFESLEKIQLFIQLRYPSSVSYKECRKN